MNIIPPVNQLYVNVLILREQNMQLPSQYRVAKKEWTVLFLNLGTTILL